MDAATRAMYLSCVMLIRECPRWSAPIRADSPASSVRVATDLRKLCEVTSGTPSSRGPRQRCPGIVPTNIIANTQFAGVSAGAEADKQQKFDRLYEKRHYTPDKVAERIVAAVAKKKSIVPVTPEAHVAYHARRFVPALGRWLAARKDIVR